ncbi:MCE family protein [Nocardioides marmoraquaticus]
MRALSKINPLIGVVLVVALVVGALVLFWPGGEKRYLTADFPRTVSLYEGSDVRILGVAVGTVETVVPRGTVVRVEMSYDAKYDVPADAKAAIIAPTIVGDRFVQLTPAYDGGEKLPDGATLGVEQTATPLELDEIFGSINQLTVALGPEQTNRPVEGGVGPLTRLLDSTARNLGGQGAQLNQTLEDVGALTKTLADNKDELFGSLEQVQQFTTTLAENDDTVRAFNDSLQSGAAVLADERQELAQALRDLGVAMREIRTFVQENKGALSRNIKGLNRLATTLVDRRDELDQILRTAPAALNNLFLAGNTDAGTLDVRNDFGQLETRLLENPLRFVCGLLGSNVPAGTCDRLGGVIETLQQQGGTGAPSLEGLQGLTGRAAALPGSKPGTVTRTPVDRSLGGLLEVAP